MEHPQSNQEQNRISEFADIVISNIEVLNNISLHPLMHILKRMF